MPPGGDAAVIEGSTKTNFESFPPPPSATPLGAEPKLNGCENCPAAQVCIPFEDVSNIVEVEIGTVVANPGVSISVVAASVDPSADELEDC